MTERRARPVAKEKEGEGTVTKRPADTPDPVLRSQDRSDVPAARREIILSDNPCPIPIDFRFLTALAR